MQAPEWPLGIRPDCTGVRPRLPVVVHLLDDDEEIITGFRSAPVESLPVPRHLRWPCAFEREHLEAVAAVGEEREAFRRFLAEMAPRLHECEYHQVDWRLAAGAATAASEARSPRRGTELADEAGRIATERGADRATVEWVESLFLDPIQITADGHFLNRGQRRVCALTAAGVARCPVLVDVKRPAA